MKKLKYNHGITSLPLMPESIRLSSSVSIVKNTDRELDIESDGYQGESVNILLNLTQFFETRIEYRFQIFTAHSCDFLLPSYARLA